MSGRNQSQCYVCHHKSHVGRVGGEEVVYEHCQTILIFFAFPLNYKMLTSFLVIYCHLIEGTSIQLFTKRDLKTYTTRVSCWRGEIVHFETNFKEPYVERARCI